MVVVVEHISKCTDVDEMGGESFYLIKRRFTSRRLSYRVLKVAARQASGQSTLLSTGNENRLRVPTFLRSRTPGISSTLDCMPKSTTERMTRPLAPHVRRRARLAPTNPAGANESADYVRP